MAAESCAAPPLGSVPAALGRRQRSAADLRPPGGPARDRRHERAEQRGTGALEHAAAPTAGMCGSFHMAAGAGSADAGARRDPSASGADGGQCAVRARDRRRAARRARRPADAVGASARVAQVEPRAVGDDSDATGRGGGAAGGIHCVWRAPTRPLRWLYYRPCWRARMPRPRCKAGCAAPRRSGRHMPASPAPSPRSASCCRSSPMLRYRNGACARRSGPRISARRSNGPSR